MFNIFHTSIMLLTISKFTLSNLKLNKFLYFFYGLLLVTKDARPFREHPEAWVYGPVFSSVYHAFKRFGAGAIKEYITQEFSEPKEKIGELEQIYELLKDFSGGQLIALTHRKGGAWEKVFEVNHNKIIPDSYIKEEFNQFYLKE